MRRPTRTVGLLIIVMLAQENCALAGMPSIRLSDLGALRLQTISFFLLGLLASAKGVQWLWNGLQHDLAQLPKLTYRRAVGLTVLWGLLFIIVLTMISGARELMTPGAWRRQGLTYQLNSAESPPVRVAADRESRRRQAERLADGLTLFARQHAGQFPEGMEDADIDESLWDVPVVSGARFRYVPGLTKEDLSRVVAYEPAVCDQPLFVITVGGRVLEMEWDVLRRALSENSP